MKIQPTLGRLILVALVVPGIALLSGFTGAARAQTSGVRSVKQANATGEARSLKENLTRRTTRAATGSAAADDDVGSISGAERFLRDRRRRTAFVGRDLNEMSSFVGEIQGSTSGNVPTAVSRMRIRLQRNANLTAQRTNQASRGIYEPPLAIGFAVEPMAAASMEATLGKLLNDSSRIHRVGSLSVTVDDRIATLAGVVASAEDRQLAEAYLRFEPGLSRVVNQLTIQQRPGQR